MRVAIAAPPVFDVALRAGAGCARLVLRGELDLAGADVLDAYAHLVHRTQLRFVLDCRALTFVDAAGARALLHARARGGELVGLHGAALRAIDLLGLAEHLAPRACEQPKAS